MTAARRTYRHRPQEVQIEADARAHSEADLKDAFGFVDRAFNLTGRPALRYTFDAATRREVERLLVELMAAWHRGSISTRAGAVAADDAPFQRMLQRVIG